LGRLGQLQVLRVTLLQRALLSCLVGLGLLLKLPVAMRTVLPCSKQHGITRY
jgi:hypothetical protein